MGWRGLGRGLAGALRGGRPPGVARGAAGGGTTGSGGGCARGREEWERQLGLLLRERPAARGAAGPREWHIWQLFVAALPPAAAAGLGAWGVQAAREGGAVPAGRESGSGVNPQEERGEVERQELREAVAGVQARLGALEGSVRELERQRQPPASAPRAAAAPAPTRARI